ncbi:MAG: DUF4886 domain-containing protein [Oscillospiraceae bacterium]|nr:DUF4886 domain-containing protein [Oscillospiraceae bacterium]
MKRVLALLCTLTLLLGMIVPGAYAVENTTCPCCGATDVTWTAFTADTVPEPGVHYRLTGKVEKSGQWVIETAGTYCIDLAGYTISTNSRAFIAGDNTDKPAVVLNITDSSANRSGVIKSKGSTNSAWSAGVLYSCNKATINLYGGTVTSADVNTASAGKGAIVNALGEFNMYGGTVIGGTAQTYGGAVSMQGNGVFTMSGGTVKSGTAPVGPCVYLGSGSKMILSGNAKVDNIYIDGTPKSSLTISGVYTGSAELSAKNEITAGTTVATADNADISGATISVAGKSLAASVSGNGIVVGEGSWCQACRKNVVWQELSETLTSSSAGHYKLVTNVGASQLVMKNGTQICLDLNGFTYASSGRAFVVGESYSAGAGEVLNIMDSSAEQTGRLTGRGGSDAHAAGVIYNYNKTTVNIYGGTIEAQGNGDVIARNGGALDIYGTVNMYGGTVIGNHVANNGGTVCLLDKNAVFNMEGGKLVSGKADNLGDCVYVASNATVKLSGAAVAGQIYFAGSSASKLQFTDDFTGKAELLFATTPAIGADIGNCSGAVGKESISIANTRLYGAVSGSNLVVAALTGASVDHEGTVAYYDTAAAALTAAQKGDTVKLLENAASVTTPDGIVLDLNGWNVDALTANGTLYVKDGATDDYTVEDPEGYGKIISASGNVQPCEGYLSLNEGGLSLHKYVLDISKVSLRPGSAGLYYTGNILVDEAVLDKIGSYGIAVSTANEKPSAEAADSRYTAFSKTDYGVKTTASVLISGIMDGESADAVDAATLIYGRPYIAFADGTYLYGKAVAASLQQVTEIVDEKAWGKMTLTQNRALMAMYDVYAADMAAWSITNMAASVAKKQAAADDGILKAIVIGNSASVDATALLAGIFKTEAPDQEFVLGCMYESGCSVKGHVGFLQTDAPAYTYYKNTGSDANGAWTLLKNSTLADGLTDQNWDVVIFQELHTISGLMSTFENDNLETLISYVINTVGYEPQLDWHSVGIIPEIPQAYADYVNSLENDDGGGTDAGENEGWEDSGVEEPEDLAWIFDIARPGYPVTWAKNYIKNFNNNAQTMYDAICDVAVNHIIPSELYSFDDVIPGGSVIQYARNMGMTDRDLFRDYAHKSDYGRVLIGYVWYASLMDITEFTELKYTTVPTAMRHHKSPQENLVLSQEQYDMALAAVNYALANPFDSPDPVAEQ